MYWSISIADVLITFILDKPSLFLYLSKYFRPWKTTSVIHDKIQKDSSGPMVGLSTTVYTYLVYVCTSVATAVRR